MECYNRTSPRTPTSIMTSPLRQSFTASLHRIPLRATVIAERCEVLIFHTSLSAPGDDRSRPATHCRKHQVASQDSLACLATGVPDNCRSALPVTLRVFAYSPLLRCGLAKLSFFLSSLLCLFSVSSRLSQLVSFLLALSTNSPESSPVSSILFSRLCLSAHVVWRRVRFVMSLFCFFLFSSLRLPSHSP